MIAIIIIINNSYFLMYGPTDVYLVALDIS